MRQDGVLHARDGGVAGRAFGAGDCGHRRRDGAVCVDFELYVRHLSQCQRAFPEIRFQELLD